MLRGVIRRPLGSTVSPAGSILVGRSPAGAANSRPSAGRRSRGAGRPGRPTRTSAKTDAASNRRTRIPLDGIFRPHIVPQKGLLDFGCWANLAYHQIFVSFGSRPQPIETRRGEDKVKLHILYRPGD